MKEIDVAQINVVTTTKIVKLSIMEREGEPLAAPFKDEAGLWCWKLSVPAFWVGEKGGRIEIRNLVATNPELTATAKALGLNWATLSDGDQQAQVVMATLLDKAFAKYVTDPAERAARVMAAAAQIAM